MERAVILGRSLIPHAIHAHKLMSAHDRVGIAAKVVQHFDMVGWPQGVLCRTKWWRALRPILGGDRATDFDAVAEKLVDCGYLIECQAPEGQKGGPKGRWWRPNRRLIQLVR